MHRNKVKWELQLAFTYVSSWQIITGTKHFKNPTTDTEAGDAGISSGLVTSIKNRAHRTQVIKIYRTDGKDKDCLL